MEKTKEIAVHQSTKKEAYFDQYASAQVTDSRRFIATPSAFAKENLFYLQEIGELRSLISHKSSREALDSFLFVLILEGSGIFHYEGITYSVQPDDILFIDCHKAYYHQSNEENPWRLLWIHFNGPNVTSYFQHFQRKHNTIALNTGEKQSFLSVVDELAHSAVQNKADIEFTVSHLLNQLLTLLIALEVKEPKTTETNSLFKIEKIKDFLDQNYTKKLSLEEIAESFFISKYHMCREFKKKYGITINSYITVKKMTYAKQLLRFSDLNMEEIGRICGIPDSSYFNKVFRKVEGMTPSEYKRKWKGKP